jgi:hypothetical protein
MYAKDNNSKNPYDLAGGALGVVVGILGALLCKVLLKKWLVIVVSKIIWIIIFVIF